MISMFKVYINLYYHAAELYSSTYTVINAHVVKLFIDITQNIQLLIIWTRFQLIQANTTYSFMWI